LQKLAIEHRKDTFPIGDDDIEFLCAEMKNSDFISSKKFLEFPSDIRVATTLILAFFDDFLDQFKVEFSKINLLQGVHQAGQRLTSPYVQQINQRLFRARYSQAVRLSVYVMNVLVAHAVNLEHVGSAPKLELTGPQIVPRGRHDRNLFRERTVVGNSLKKQRIFHGYVRSFENGIGYEKGCLLGCCLTVEQQVAVDALHHLFEQSLVYGPLEAVLESMGIETEELSKFTRKEKRTPRFGEEPFPVFQRKTPARSHQTEK